jgi:hypothetical protein
MGFPALLFVLGSSVLPVSGCVAGGNVPPVTNDGGSFERVFADVILDVTTPSLTESCIATGGLPVCMTPAVPQTGPCAGNPAIGAPDNHFFTIQPSGRLDLGFLCSLITPNLLDTQGMLQPDFIIYGSLVDNATAAVEVSFDGSSYEPLNKWMEKSFAPETGAQALPGAAFELQAANVTSARFVRISETSGVGTISIDALEALMGFVQ